MSRIRARRRPHSAWVLALLPLAFTPQALAQQTGQDSRVQELAPVAVEGEAARVPVWATRTDSDTREARFIDSWDDLGKRAEPGVNFERSTQSVNIRGLDRDRVLTTIDGIRIPWLNDGSRGVNGGLDSINFNGLSSIDVIRGVNSSLFGSGALGGVLALRTLDPDDILQPGRNFGALLKGSYDGADRSTGADVALAGRHNDTSWLVQGGYREGSELRNRGDVGGYGIQRSETNPEDFTRKNALLKLQQRFSGGHKLGLTADFFDGRRDIDTRTAQGAGTSFLQGENTSREENRRSRISLAYDFRATSADSLFDEADAIIYWQRQERSSQQDGIRALDARAAMPNFIFGPLGNPYKYPSGPFGRSNDIEQTMAGTSGSLARKFALGNSTHRLRLGGEWYRIRVEQYSGGYDNCPAQLSPIQPAGPAACSFLHTNQADTPDARGTQWALALDDEIRFGEGRFSLTPGVRYDHFRYNPRESAQYAENPNANGALPDSNSGSKLSSRLLASWQVHEQLALQAQWAQGFKAPSAAQLYKNYGGPGTYLRVGNPDLKPEESQGFEVGARVGGDELGGTFTVFDNRYRNFIDETVAVDPASIGIPPGLYPNGVTGAQNRERVRIYGAEATAHWKFAHGWHTWGSLAWAVGKDRDEGTYLNSVAPLRGTVALGYARQHWGADVIFTAATSRHKVEDPDADFQAPGYGVFDMTAFWEPAAVKGLRLQAGVFNVFDKKYWNALNVPTDLLAQPTTALPIDYYTEPGRQFRVSLSYRY